MLRTILFIAREKKKHLGMSKKKKSNPPNLNPPKQFSIKHPKTWRSNAKKIWFFFFLPPSSLGKRGRFFVYKKKSASIQKKVFPADLDLEAIFTFADNTSHHHGRRWRRRVQALYGFGRTDRLSILYPNGPDPIRLGTFHAKAAACARRTAFLNHY